MSKIMNKFFLLIFLFFHSAWACELQEDEIVYTFKINENNANQFDISVELIGDDSGKTKMVFPWGEINPYLVDSNISFSIDGNSQTVPLSGSSLTVIHNPNTKLKFSYSVLDDKKASSAKTPFIQDDFFTFCSGVTLIHPDINFYKKIKLTFDFSGIDEEYKILSSLGISRKLTVNKTLNDLYFLQFTGVKEKLAAYDAGNAVLYIVEHGHWPELMEEKPSDIFMKILNYQRNEMEDGDFPYYVATINQQPEGVPAKLIFGLHNKNHLYISFPDGPSYKLDRVKYAMVHEIFHGWLGNKISLPVSESMPNKWFSEGFTEHFSMLFSKKGNFIGEEMYLSRLNDWAKEYSSNIYRTASNQLYAKLDNWTIPENQFENARGFFLAQWFVEMLKEKNMHPDSIKFFIKALVSETYDKKLMFSEEMFWSTFDKFFDADFKALVDKHIHNGELMTLPPIEGYILQEKDMEVIDVGFDIIESIKTGKITGLKPESPAVESGLKENAIYENHMVIYESLDTLKVYVMQNINDKSEVVSYVAERVNKKIPQYVKINPTVL